MKLFRVAKYTLVSFIFLAFIFNYVTVNAAFSNISHAYHEASLIPYGSIVSLDPSRQSYITAINSSSTAAPIGVIVQNNESLLAINSSDTTVQVATSGVASVLVNNVNGNIKIGDQVSISPFSGIGMAAIPGVKIIGVAQNSFSQSSTGATAESIEDNTGKTQKIYVGYIKIEISIGNGTSNGLGGNQANFLQKLIKSLTGRTISTVRIIVAMVVTLVALISLVTIVYASIFGTIISVGRNPLARAAIFRTLGAVLIMALVTVSVACVTIYYLLK
jgi:hypothetical protein